MPKLADGGRCSGSLVFRADSARMLAATDGQPVSVSYSLLTACRLQPTSAAAKSPGPGWQHSTTSADVQ